MVRLVQTIRRLLRRLGRNDRGVAVIEFALIAPVMIFTYLGSVEASSLISTDRKVQSVAGTIGDLVARSDGSVSTSQMRDYFRAATGIMLPYPSAPVKQVVTAINVDNNGKATVSWSRQYYNGNYSTSTPYSPGSTYTLPAQMVAISKGKTVIAAEASYAYQPMFVTPFNAAINLYRSSFFMPRFGGTIAIN